MYALIIGCKNESGEVEQVIVNNQLPRNITVSYEDGGVKLKANEEYFRNVVDAGTGYYQDGKLIADTRLVKNGKIVSNAIDLFINV